MGRHKRSKDLPFFKFYKIIVSSAAWKAINHPARVAYLHLGCKFNGFNHDDLSLTYKEMEPFMQPRTFSKAMKELIEVGFVDVVRPGGLYKQCKLYRLSERWKQYDRS